MKIDWKSSSSYEIRIENCDGQTNFIEKELDCIEWAVDVGRVKNQLRKQTQNITKCRKSAL